MTFPSSHVFHDVGPIMVWDSCWVEPHVDGWEHAMAKGLVLGVGEIQIECNFGI